MRKETQCTSVIFLITTLFSMQSLSKTYDIGAALADISGTGNITSVEGHLSSDSIGTFIGIESVEAYLNGATFQIRALVDSEVVYTLNNSNATWDVQFGGSGGNITLTSSSEQLEFDFSTPNEVSAVDVFLRNTETWDVFQLTQSNNVSNQSFIHLATGNLVQSIDHVIEYDSAIVFSVPTVETAAPNITISNIPLTATNFTAGDGEVTVFRFNLNSDSTDAEIRQLTLGAFGELDEASALGHVSLYIDEDDNDLPDAEELIASGNYPSDNGALTFSFTEAYRLPAGDTQFIVTYDF